MSEISKENYNTEDNGDVEKISLENIEEKGKSRALLYGLIAFVPLIILIILSFINGGRFDYNLSIIIQTFYSSYNIFNELAVGFQYLNFISYGIMIITGIIVFLHYIPITKLKVKSIAKYAGLILSVGIFASIGSNVLLKFIFNRSLPSQISDFSQFQMIFIRSNNLAHDFFYSSFPNSATILIGILLTLPLCFNRRKTNVLKWISAILIILFVIFVGFIEIGNQSAWFSDVIVSIIIDSFFAGFFYGKILFIYDQEIFDIYNRVHKPHEDAYQKVLNAREKIAEDPNSALDLLNEAITLYNRAIERAKIEPGDFQYVITRSRYWISIVKKLISRYHSLQTKSGTEFDKYMKNWIYII